MSQRPQQYKESHVADTEDPPRSSMRPISILHRHFRPTQNDDEEELDDAISSTVGPLPIMILLMFRGQYTAL